MASFIVNKLCKASEYTKTIDGHEYTVNPEGYQCVLYVTVVLYIISLLIALFMVKPTTKALEAKKNKAA